MTHKNKRTLLTIVIVIAALFVLSFFYTLIKNYPNLESAYDMGYSTGLLFGRVLKVVAIPGLIVLALVYFRKNLSR